MKHAGIKTTLLAAFAIAATGISARTYVVERGDTWELIARKWGVHTEELKAANPAMPEVFYGLEINLPENSAPSQVSNSTIALYEREDRQLAAAEKALAEGRYSAARSALSSAMSRRGHTTSRLAYMYAKSCEGTQNYMEALENYGKAISLFNDGDWTMTGEQVSSVEADRDRVYPLAEKEYQEKLRREAEEKRQAEIRRQRRAEEAAREEARKRERRAAWGSFGQALLGAIGNAAMGASGGWGMPAMGAMPAWNTPVPSFGGGGTASPILNPQLAAAGVTLPPSLDFTKWDPSMFQMQVTYDQAGTPMFSSPGLAAWQMQSAAEVGSYAAAVGAQVGGAQGAYLQNLASSHVTHSAEQAQWTATPHYAPTQEDIDRQREITAQSHRDFRESLTSARDNLENIKEYNRLKYGAGSSSSGTSSAAATTTDRTGNQSSSTNKTTSRGATSQSTSGSDTHTPGTSTHAAADLESLEEEKPYDAHQQHKNGNLNTSSDTYDYKKRVTLYKQDGSKYRSFKTNIELYKKGATYFIKIGNTFYPADGVYTRAGYNMRIVYGGNGLFFRL